MGVNNLPMQSCCSVADRPGVELATLISITSQRQYAIPTEPPSHSVEVSPVAKSFNIVTTEGKHDCINGIIIVIIMS